MQVEKIIKEDEMLYRAAKWFSCRWDIPHEAYLESMKEGLCHKIPAWYLVIEGDTIIGGAGVIENDFHHRKDLSPNICALYIEEAYRKKGIARKLLGFIEEDMRKHGFEKIYLISDLVGFYERLGYTHLCDAMEESGYLIKMYEKEIIVSK